MGPCTFAEQPKEAFAQPVAEQPEGAFAQPISELPEGAFAQLPEQSVAQLFCGTVARLAATSTRTIENLLRLPSFSGHPISADLVSVGEDVHCEFVKEEVHPGVPAGGRQTGH